MIILVPVLIAAAGLIAWLFPYGEGYKHYEGMGEQPAGYKSWDAMGRDERERSAVAMRKDEL